MLNVPLFSANIMKELSPFFSTILIANAVLGFLGLVLGIIAILGLRKFNNKLKDLFAGKKATDLESVIISQGKELEILDKEIQELFEISNRIHSLTLKSIHKIGIIRFNPFKDIGGDQSFALALLDGKDSGIVISSLHTREGTRIYSKPVTKGISEKYVLTEEEKVAIKQATAVKNSKI